LGSKWRPTFFQQIDRPRPRSTGKTSQKSRTACPSTRTATGGGTAGTAAFEHKDYRGAANYWEKVVQTAPTDSEFACSIGNSLEEARALAEGRQPVAALSEIMPVKPVPMGQATQSSSAER
jgi:Flp pilus assembly protein TadD